MPGKKKSKPHKCSTPGCKNKTTWKKCKACFNRDHRKRHPIWWAWVTLKNNAKRRKKFFDLTLEQFTQFCIKTEYMQNKGITKDCFSVDRKDETKGYTVDNLQVLTVGQNKKKYLNYDWETGTAKVVTTGNSKEPPEDLPF